MNNSGIGFKDFLRMSGLNVSEVLVVYDDFALPFGTIRMRKYGSDGGHNGLSSIISEANTNNIPRLRLGIGPIESGSDIVDFVLGNFNAEEKKFLDEFVEKAAESVVAVFTMGINKAMSKFNKNLLVEENDKKN
jgi:PTH1 family peptidyl-tRNA hydrolase